MDTVNKNKFKTQYKPHPPRQFSFTPSGESRTQQQFKQECDVNHILAKYKKTGMISHLNKHQGQFGDFSNLEDYQTSLIKLQTAQESFNALPSELRSKFQNDPAQLIAFLSDPKNKEEAKKYNLLKPEIIPTETKIENAFEKALEKNDQKRSKAKETKS